MVAVRAAVFPWILLDRPCSRLHLMLRCRCFAGKKQLVRNSRDATIVTGPFLFWGFVIILIYAITIAQLGKVCMRSTAASNCPCVLSSGMPGQHTTVLEQPKSSFLPVMYVCCASLKTCLHQKPSHKSLLQASMFVLRPSLLDCVGCCRQVTGPFRMLNMINFLVFRITRGVLFGLEICMASPDVTKIVRPGSTTWSHQGLQPLHQ